MLNPWYSKNMKYFLAFLLLSTSFVLPKVNGAEDQQTYNVALYYSPRCPYSKKVLAYLQQHSLTIPLKNVLGDQEAKDELVKYGGYLIVPCLVVNGNAIYDAQNIIDWLSQNQQYLSK
ncbi:MAG: glutaredoxin [Verrucomicrobia bacterium]|nr:glutaredoxin [Verrucomicrobiota bacterium]